MSLGSFLSNAFPAAGAIVGSLGGPVGSIVGGSLGNMLGGYFGDKADEDQSLRMLQAQTESQKQLFDYISEYNSPMNQRKRLEEAGYNPALMYGQGQTTQSMPTTSAPAINRYSRTGLSAEQIANVKNLDADTGLTKAEIAQKAVQLTILDIEKEHKGILRDIAMGTKDAAIEAERLKNTKLAKDALKAEREADLALEEIGLKREEINRVKESLRGLKITNDLQQMYKEIEESLGWLASDKVQNLTSLGLDFIGDIIGIWKFVKGFKAPKMVGKKKDVFHDHSPFGGSHTQTFEEYEYK